MTLRADELADPAAARAAVRRGDRTEPTAYGDAVEVRPGEVPVFWACGVTPQSVAAASRPELMITHRPGHMFVTDEPGAGRARASSR